MADFYSKLEVGDLVQCRDIRGWSWSNKLGKVIGIRAHYLSPDDCTLKVEFDHEIQGRSIWDIGRRYVFKTTLEEYEKVLDDKRRHEHAMKYL